ncbi:MAG TPA: hypothetical protein PLU17_02895 [Chitinophagaceae bacterium]|jgi:hypothetical protein|nr:hypothetical protein [Chitinophagaceae bacterium]
MITRQTLLEGWHFMRWLRLGIGIAIAYQAIRMNDAISGVIAFVVLLQAVLNIGCCGVNGCATPISKSQDSSMQDVEFEEVTVPKA